MSIIVYHLGEQCSSQLGIGMDLISIYFYVKRWDRLPYLTLDSDRGFDSTFPLSPAALSSLSDGYRLTALYFNVPIRHASSWSTISVSEGVTAAAVILRT